MRAFTMVSKSRFGEVNEEAFMRIFIHYSSLLVMR